MEKVLIIGSGPSARQYTNYPYKDNGWKIATINHGWDIEPAMDLWVTSTDYKGRGGTFPDNKDSLPIITDYTAALGKFGGHVECGYSITLATGYNVLHKFKPSIIGFLGCDMNYTPDAKGHTHIYGIGLDIKRDGIPDPERMANQYGKKDPDYLTNLYKRLADKAGEQLCTIYNFSVDPATKLPYPVSTPEDIDV